jgi:hypothetical protein
MGPVPPQTLPAALDLAARAPSAHNTQPWMVRTAGAELHVLADPGRWLRHSDPTARDLRLGLGGFVEALRLALAAEGLRFEREAPPPGAFAVLRAGGSGKPAKADQLAASLLRRRQTSRLRYSPRPPEPAALAALGAAASSAGLRLHLAGTQASERADWQALFHAAVRESWLDARSVNELRAWIRFDPEGARGPSDGLSTHCLGLGVADTAALLAILHPGLWRAARKVWAAPALASALAAQESRTLGAAPFLGVLVAEAEAGTVGAGLLQVWLAATQLGLALAPISVLLDRRGWELGRRLGVAPDRLVLAFRLGRSAPAPWSGRRPATQFATLS